MNSCALILYRDIYAWRRVEHFITIVDEKYLLVIAQSVLKRLLFKATIREQESSRTNPDYFTARYWRHGFQHRKLTLFSLDYPLKYRSLQTPIYHIHPSNFTLIDSRALTQKRTRVWVDTAAHSSHMFTLCAWEVHSDKIVTVVAIAQCVGCFFCNDRAIKRWFFYWITVERWKTS